MVQKRPCADDQPNDVSSKQAKRLEPYSQLVLALEFPYEDTVQGFHASGKDDNKYSTYFNAEINDSANGVFAEHQFSSKKDVEETSPNSVACFSWASGISSEEETNFEVPFCFPVPTDSYIYGQSPRTNFHHGAAISSFYMDNPPRKIIPTGPQFQADVPEWCPYQMSNSNTELAGTVFIAMPDSKESGGIGSGRTNCACKYVGSVSCVRQHILEAREKLMKKVGKKAFFDLGFGEMGEVVAELWSAEEEQLFQEVVFSNPVSLKKNFWDHLAIMFPSRTKKEIVSYYFNVFMLQTRTQQNRFDPMNADSDNDEWEAIDDLTDVEDEIEDGGNPPVVSPVETDGVENFNKNMGPYDYEDPQNNPLEYNSINSGSKSADLSKEGKDKVNSKCDSDYGGVDFKFCMGRSENFKQRTDHYGGSNHEFEWDVGYLSCPSKEMELLPTCSMIEEVFGAGSWNHKAGDGR